MEMEKFHQSAFFTRILHHQH